MPGHSPVILAIPGTSSLAHLEESMRAGDIELSPEDRAASRASRSTSTVRCIRITSTHRRAGSRSGAVPPSAPNT
ncbi:hypothetical protein [Sinosporangium siamense]|uniref:hypothetical protein n=1 Tax=Sinosporangium siamense TaxID=1367973 RepID=UPI0019522CE2